MMQNKVPLVYCISWSNCVFLSVSQCAFTCAWERVVTGYSPAVATAIIHSVICLDTHFLEMVIEEVSICWAVLVGGRSG